MNISYKIKWEEVNEMAVKERGTITLNKEETVAFANKKFKPFNNRLQEKKKKNNPFIKLAKNGKN